MRAITLGLATALLAGVAHAATYTETGDAGQTLATAASAMTGGGAALASISGRLDTNDADLFRIYISDPSSFSATTFNSGTDDAALDTEIFLFDSAGHAVAANDDDQGGFSVDSTLPLGDGHYAGLTAGEYILGVSISGNDPVNLNNQLLFEMSGDTTQVRGAAGGLNPTTLADFDGFQYYTNDPGTYRIDLTGVSTGPMSAAPEPGTWTLMIAGVALAGAALRTGRRALTPA